MNFQAVIDELRFLNGTALRTADQTEVLVETSNDMIKHLEDLVDAMRDGIDQQRDTTRQAIMSNREAKLRNRKEEEADRNRNDDFLAGLLGIVATVTGSLYALAFGVAIAWGRVRGTFDDMEESFQTLISRIVAVVAILNPMVLIKGFRMAFSIFAALPMQIINGIIKLFASMPVIRNIRQGFHRMTLQAMNRVSQSISGVFRSIFNSSFVTSVRNAMKPVTDTLKFVGKVVGMLGSFFAGPVRGATSALVSIARGAIRFFSPIGRIIGVMLRTVARISGVFTIVMVAVDALAGAYRAFASGGDMVDIFRGAVEGAINGFVNIFRDIAGLLTDLIGWIAGRLFGEEVGNRVQEALSNFFGNLFSVIDTMVQIFGDITEWLMRLPLDIWDFFVQLFDNPAIAARNLFDNTVEAIGNLFNYMVMVIRATIGDSIRSLGNLIGNFPGADALRDRINRFADWVGGDYSVLDGTLLRELQGREDERNTRTSSGPRSLFTAGRAEDVETPPMTQASVAVNYSPSVSNTNVNAADMRATINTLPPMARNGNYASAQRQRMIP